MSLKIEFVEKASQTGAKVAALCREYGISRPTGYKWIRRFQEQGYSGLDEVSRRPKGSPLATGEEVVMAILAAREAHPSWGPKKLRVLLGRRLKDATPSEATIARVLRRCGRIRSERKQKKICVVQSAPKIPAEHPNDLWTVDFKGWWQSLDGKRCEPLTIRDGCSRYVLVSKLTRSSREQVQPVFEAAFRRYGLPRVIQCDNGVPFASVTARGGLTRLSAWWISLGIRFVRGRPACPQDNGGHERMHRDIAAEVEASPSATIEQQQRCLDRWRQEFNHVRPHEALGQKTPADVYSPANKRKMILVPPEYSPRCLVRKVGKEGHIHMGKETYFVSLALAGFQIGLEPLGGLKWQVWFYDLNLGCIEVVPNTISELAA